jgi:hypothetical protein
VATGGEPKTVGNEPRELFPSYRKAAKIVLPLPGPNSPKPIYWNKLSLVVLRYAASAATTSPFNTLKANGDEYGLSKVKVQFPPKAKLSGESTT